MKTKWLLSVMVLLLCHPLLAEIRGEVRDTSQNPIADAHVLLTNVAKPELRFEFDTDERGVFATDTVPNGVYWLDISADGFVPFARMPVDIHYPRGYQAGFCLFRPDEPGPPRPHYAELWGELSDSSGPVANARVCLLAEGEGKDRKKQSCTVTNRFGQYALSVTPGLYHGSVVLDNQIWWEGRLALNEPQEYRDPIALE
jgi:hypothetical protein